MLYLLFDISKWAQKDQKLIDYYSLLLYNYFPKNMNG
jgi:hypothetical protein